MDYEMKKVSAPSDVRTCKEMANYILTLLKGSNCTKDYQRHNVYFREITSVLDMGSEVIHAHWFN